MTNFDSLTYSISEAADKLSISEKTLRRWEEAGRFTPARTDGNQRKYTNEDLQILDAIKHSLIESQKDLLSAEQATALLGVTEPTLTRLVAEGKLHPFVTLNNSYFPRHRLLPLLKELNRSDDKPKKLTPLESSLTPPPPSHINRPRFALTQLFSPAFALNLTTTLLLIGVYHLIFNSQLRSPLAPTPQESGSVQGAATNPTLLLLDDMLDPTTNGLTATTITSKLGTITPNLTLLPGVSPTSPTAGSLYFDASDNTLKIYTNLGWQTLTSQTELNHLKLDLESKIATESSAPL